MSTFYISHLYVFLDTEKKLHLYKNMDNEVQKAANEFQAILNEFKTH